jgi:hypothetical protein
VRVGRAQGSQEFAQQPVVSAWVLVQGQHPLHEEVSVQAVLEGIEANLLLALRGARPGGLLGVAAVGLRLLGGGFTLVR